MWFAYINRWGNGKHEPTIKIKRKLKALFKEYGILSEYFFMIQVPIINYYENMRLTIYN